MSVGSLRFVVNPPRGALGWWILLPVGGAAIATLWWSAIGTQLSISGFIDGLRYDTWKLNGPMRLGLGGARKISLGLFFSPESEEQLAMLTGYEIRYTPHREIGIAFLVA